MQKAAWEIAKMPDNEEERLAELINYEVLDTPKETVFDRLTRMASESFDVPIALISLVDRERQWFKSSHGLAAKETARDVAFCSHTILQDEVTVVPDATNDPRFALNPLVQNEPTVRFYAGAPLVTPKGYKLGTICLIDNKPRHDFTEKNKQELKDLAAIVIDELELRVAMKKVREDIEKLNIAKKELEKERERTEQTMQEKSHFIATISHELRTPMNGILGMAYLLGDTNLDDTQKEYIATINHSASNLMLLINDVLDLSKIEAHELILEKIPFNIKDYFIQNIKLLTPLSVKKGIELVYEIDSSLPDIIINDPGRFSQIITNLVGNAIKFTEIGKVTARIGYNSIDNNIYCEVIDTGIGIPENKRGKIFEKFIQGDPTITRKYGGTGLGLTITKQLVVMLGGDIDFETHDNKGTRFWFTIPATLPEDEQYEESTTKILEAKTIRKDAGKCKILIAEDNPINHLFLSKLLKKFGFYNIDIAENGNQALQFIENNPSGYDAIFMDCMMPEKDGYQTTREIRKKEQSQGFEHALIIAMTANAMFGDREACFNAGMDEYLSKPLEPEQLKEILQQWFVLPSQTANGLKNNKNSSPPFSLERLKMVAETKQEKQAIFELFFAIEKETLEKMKLSRRDKEFNDWKNAAHCLKGSAANLGMTSLLNKLEQAENAKNASYDDRTVLLNEITREVEYINQYIKGL